MHKGWRLCAHRSTWSCTQQGRQVWVRDRGGVLRWVGSRRGPGCRLVSWRPPLALPPHMHFGRVPALPFGVLFRLAWVVGAHSALVHSAAVVVGSGMGAHRPRVNGVSVGSSLSAGGRST